MKNFLIFFLFLYLLPANTFADFKQIKKKATVNNPEIIFPVPTELSRCQTEMIYNLEFNPVNPILKLDAPEGYGLDERFSDALDKFDRFSFPCSAGNSKACEYVVQVLKEWAKVNAAKRTGPSDEEGKHWNDTLTVNLFVASPMISAYSFAKQVIKVSDEDDELIKKWFTKIVKKNEHLMYSKTYDYGGASGTPKRAHNHALMSAVAHMSLGILISNDKIFRKAFKNYEAAIKYQRKDGSLPIETRRGGRAMFYQARAMNALAVIAIIAENQGYDIWSYDYKGKNYHQLVKFFLDFVDNNEVVFPYAKEMRFPGPAKNYKKQDLQTNSSSNWGWLYAYVSRFPDHKNAKRLKELSLKDKSEFNPYQYKIIWNYNNIGNKSFSSATWTAVEPNCHFVK
jgi:hypothetical protein